VESLAFFVAILLLIALLAGPLSIALSSQFVKSRLETKASLVIVILNLLRKFVHFILVAIGNLIGVMWLFTAELPFIPRLIGLFALITSYIGLRREYFPEFFLMRDLFAKFGVSRKNGRTSGKDGNGPAGQH
jgi:hypothetical protein